jgi:cytoskeleton protein RodZ
VTVGETLSHARRERALSVEDVAAGTRIRATLVRAIESDDFRLCGGTVYARGHIRSIARVVGVDPEPVIAEFDAAHHVEPAATPVTPEPSDQEFVSRFARSERRRPNWTVAAIAALVVICAAALTPVIFGHSHHPTKQATQTHSTAPRTTPTVTDPPESAPPVTVVPQAASGATMLVRTARGETWLSIKTKTGKTLYEGLLAAGQQKVFKSRYALAFVIGDAPAVDVVVNGHDIGSPPSSGNVSRGSVVPGANTVHQA